MVLATWADKNVTPKTECAWALAHGFKAPHQGTYYGYFKPAAARYGLTAYMMNGANIYGNSGSKYHAMAKAEIDKGNLVIACMGKGNWTRSGHFVLVWKIAGDVIYINDPASTKPARTRGSYSLFKRQVKYYFVIERPKSAAPTPKPQPTKPIEEDDDMDIKKIIEQLTPEMCYGIMAEAMNYADKVPEPDWSKKEGHWAKATSAGLVNGEAPERPLRRDEFIAVMGRKGLI